MKCACSISVMNDMLSAIKQFYLLQCAHKCTQLANFSLLVFCHILNARFTCFSRMRNIFRVRIWVGIFNSNHYMQCMQQLCQSKLCEGEWNVFFFACTHASTCMVSCNTICHAGFGRSCNVREDQQNACICLCVIVRICLWLCIYTYIACMLLIYLAHIHIHAHTNHAHAHVCECTCLCVIVRTCLW